MEFKSVGSRLKYVREGVARMTQEKFGESVDVSASLINLMESGKKPVTKRTLKSICRRFDVDKSWLETGQGIIPAPSDGVAAECVKKIQGSDSNNYDLARGLLRTIYDSGDQALVGAIFSNLRAFSAAAQKEADIAEIKRDITKLNDAVSKIVDLLGLHDEKPVVGTTSGPRK